MQPLEHTLEAGGSWLVPEASGMQSGSHESVCLTHTPCIFCVSYTKCVWWGSQHSLGLQSGQKLSPDEVLNIDPSVIQSIAQQVQQQMQIQIPTQGRGNEDGQGGGGASGQFGSGATALNE